MSSLKRAILYLTRKKVRGAILLVTFLVLAVFSMICLSVSMGAGSELKRLEESLASSFTIEYNANLADGASELPDDFKYITEEDIKYAKQLDGVKDGFTYRQDSVWTELELRYGFEQYILDNPLEGMTQNTVNFYELLKQETKVYGCYSSDMHEFFRTGAFEIVEGRHIQPGDNNKVVISREVADRNGLKIGDCFETNVKSFTQDYWSEVNDPSFDAQMLDPEKSEYALYGPVILEIVGIYKLNFNQAAGTTEYEDSHVGYYTSAGNYPESVMFTDIHTIFQYYDIEKSARNCTEPTGEYAAPKYKFLTVFVENPQSIDGVMESAKTLGFYDDRYYSIGIDTEAYEVSAKPLKQLQTVSVVLIVISVIACVVILWLVSAMWTKSRRKEIGILIALGNSKRQILTQLFVEMIVVCILSLVLALLITALIIGPVGGIANDIFSPDANLDRYAFYETAENYGVLQFEVRSGEPINLSYFLTFTPVVITAILLMCVSLISLAASSLSIMKLRPRDIFSKW